MTGKEVKMSEKVRELHQALAREYTQISEENDFIRSVIFRRSIEEIDIDDLYARFFEYLRYGLQIFESDLGFTTTDLDDIEELYEPLALLEAQLKSTDSHTQVLREAEDTICYFVVTLFQHIVCIETGEVEVPALS